MGHWLADVHLEDLIAIGIAHTFTLSHGDSERSCEWNIPGIWY